MSMIIERLQIRITELFESVSLELATLKALAATRGSADERRLYFAEQLEPRMSAIIDRLQSQITELFDNASSELALLKEEMREDRLLIEQQTARIRELEKMLATYERAAKKAPTPTIKKKTKRL
jgi:hypothetical protein